MQYPAKRDKTAYTGVMPSADLCPFGTSLAGTTEGTTNPVQTFHRIFPGEWRNGIRTGLKILGPKGIESSSLSSPIILTAFLAGVYSIYSI